MTTSSFLSSALTPDEVVRKRPERQVDNQILAQAQRSSFGAAPSPNLFADVGEPLYTSPAYTMASK